MSKARNFRITVDLSRFFNDHRRLAKIFINNSVESIQDLQNRINAIFGITGFYLFTQNHFLPLTEDVRVLINDEVVCAIPCTHPEEQPLISLNASGVDQLPPIAEESSDVSTSKKKHKKRKSLEVTSDHEFSAKKSKKHKASKRDPSPTISEKIKKHKKDRQSEIVEQDVCNIEPSKKCNEVKEQFTEKVAKYANLGHQLRDDAVRLSRHVDTPRKVFSKYVMPKSNTEEYLAKKKINIVRIDVIRESTVPDKPPEEERVGKDPESPPENIVKSIVNHLEKNLSPPEGETTKKGEQRVQVNASDYTKNVLDKSNLKFVSSDATSSIECPRARSEISQDEPMDASLNLKNNISCENAPEGRISKISRPEAMDESCLSLLNNSYIAEGNSSLAIGNSDVSCKNNLADRSIFEVPRAEAMDESCISSIYHTSIAERNNSSLKMGNSEVSSISSVNNKNSKIAASKNNSADRRISEISRDESRLSSTNNNYTTPDSNNSEISRWSSLGVNTLSSINSSYMPENENSTRTSRDITTVSPADSKTVTVTGKHSELSLGAPFTAPSSVNDCYKSPESNINTRESSFGGSDLSMDTSLTCVRHNQSANESGFTPNNLKKRSSSYRKYSGIGSLLEQLKDSDSVLSHDSDSSVQFVTKRKRVRHRKRKSNVDNAANTSTEVYVAPLKVEACPKLHITFNDEEAEVQQNSATTEIIMQNEELEDPVLEDKSIFSEEYILNAPMMGAKTPSVGDIIAFKVLKLSENYTPSVSNYVVGKMVNWDGERKIGEFNILRGQKELEVPFEQPYLKEESEKIISNFTKIKWEKMLLPRLLLVLP